MEYSANIVEMLGTSRVTALEERLAAIRACVASAPDRTSWVKHLPIPLGGSDPLVAHDELVDRLRNSSPDWFYVTGARGDGRRFGYASDLFRPHEPHSGAHIGQFLLFDMHSSLGGWWLSHVWRAADFAETTCASLAEWRVLPATACARALLEGVAAFVIEGEQLLGEWSGFKQRGVPDLAAVTAFREGFNTKLLQAQFGSRLGERTVTKVSPLKRTNVMTLLEKFSKRNQSDVMTSYEWLCDAVHPSFGFQTVYVATQRVHRTGATFAADLARRTDIAQTQAPKIEPTVALACADVFIISVDALLAQVPRLRWFIDDFGLTTGVAFDGLAGSVGRISNTEKTANCPCGSELRFENCRHVWGDNAEPPVVGPHKG
jgi:hypothetical protein